MGRAEAEDDEEMGRPVRDRDHDGEQRHELTLVLFSHWVSEPELISRDFAHNFFRITLQVCFQDVLRQSTALDLRLDSSLGSIV